MLSSSLNDKCDMTGSSNERSTEREHTSSCVTSFVGRMDRIQEFDQWRFLAGWRQTRLEKNQMRKRQLEMHGRESTAYSQFLLQWRASRE